MSNDEFYVDLFESLTKSGAINCIICKNLLSAPVIIEKDSGNICSSCYDEGRIYHGLNIPEIRNSSIEAVLNIIKVLCPNREFGCKEILLHKDLQDHKIHCKFIPRTCPLPEIRRCNFKGITEQIMLHIKKNHENNILIPTNNKYVVKIHQSTKDYVALLQTEEYLIKMSIIIDVDRTMKFRFSNIFNSTSYEGKVTITGEDEKVSTQYNFQVTPTGSNNITVNLASLTDEIQTRRLSRRHSAGLTKFTTFTCEFIIQTCGRKKEIKSNENILQEHLSCPVCLSVMKAPIYLCTNGHSICSNCQKRLSNCPTCRISMGKAIRNYALEDIAATYHCGGGDPQLKLWELSDSELGPLGKKRYSSMDNLTDNF